MSSWLGFEMNGQLSTSLSIPSPSSTIISKSAGKLVSIPSVTVNSNGSEPKKSGSGV